MMGSKFNFSPKCRKDIFLNSLIKFLKFAVMNEISYSLCLLPVLFSTVKLNLGPKHFPNWDFGVLVLGCTSKFFRIRKEISEFLNVALDGLLSFSHFRKKDGFRLNKSLGCTSKLFTLH